MKYGLDFIADMRFRVRAEKAESEAQSERLTYILLTHSAQPIWRQGSKIGVVPGPTTTQGTIFTINVTFATFVVKKKYLKSFIRSIIGVMREEFTAEDSSP